MVRGPWDEDDNEEEDSGEDAPAESVSASDDELSDGADDADADAAQEASELTPVSAATLTDSFLEGGTSYEARGVVAFAAACNVRRL